MANLKKIEVQGKFKSTDPNCLVQSFELLPFSDEIPLDPMFKLDNKKFEISFKKGVPVGIYKALLHPTSHLNA